MKKAIQQTIMGLAALATTATAAVAGWDSPFAAFDASQPRAGRQMTTVAPTQTVNYDNYGNHAPYRYERAPRRIDPRDAIYYDDDGHAYRLVPVRQGRYMSTGRVYLDLGGVPVPVLKYNTNPIRIRTNHHNEFGFHSNGLFKMRYRDPDLSLGWSGTHKRPHYKTKRIGVINSHHRH